MGMIWHIARQEFRLQRRGGVLWLAALSTLVFLIGYVLPGIVENGQTATSQTPIMRPFPSSDGVIWVDMAVWAREALALDSFSFYQAWIFADLVGLVMPLVVGLLGAFVWQRDQRRGLDEVLRARPVTAWQYVFGKYLGLMLVWGTLLTLLILVGGVVTQLVAAHHGLVFHWIDFAGPILASVGVTLLAGSALILALSLFLRSAVAALLVYLVVWLVSMTQILLLIDGSNLQILTAWMWRITSGLTDGTYHTIQTQMELLAWNRFLMVGLSIGLLAIVAWVYSQRMPGVHAWRLRLRLPQLTRRAMPQVGWRTLPSVALLRYQGRLAWGLTAWLASFAGLIIPLIVFFPNDWGPPSYWALRTTETFGPLLGVLVMMPLLAQEWQRGTADVWLSKPLPRIRVVLSRIVVGAGATLLAVLVMALMIRRTVGPLPWGELLLVTMAPALYLGMLGLVAATLARNTAVGLLVAIAYWVFEMTTRGAYTGSFFLFNRTTSTLRCERSVEDCIAILAAGPWLSTKLVLLGSSVALAALATVLLSDRVRRQSIVRRRRSVV